MKVKKNTRAVVYKVTQYKVNKPKKVVEYLLMRTMCGFTHQLGKFDDFSWAWVAKRYSIRKDKEVHGGREEWDHFIVKRVTTVREKILA